MAKYKLGEIAPIQQGIVPQSETYWLLNLDMVESNTGDILEYLYVPLDKVGASTISFDMNNVLYSKLRPYLNKVVIPDRPGYATSEMLPLKPNKDYVTREYLTYFLRSPKFVAYINEKTSGAKMPRTNSSDLKSIEIECPSLEKQRHITNEFDRIVSIIRLRQQQLQKLDELVKARFVEMFGDPVTNLRGYEKRKLRELTAKISDGVHAKPVYTETGRPFLSVVNINKGTINFDGCKFVSEEAYQKMIKSTHPERGDVLYTKVGATYGIPAYVDTDIKFCLYVSVCLIKPKHDEINSRFLALSMNMPYIKRQADSRIKGIGVPDLHLNQISEFDILCPPRNEQETFISLVEQIDKSKVAVQKALDEAQLLFDSLMQQYFA